MGFSLTVDIGKLSTFQIGEIWLKISIEMEEDFERKVKPVNDEGLEEVYMIQMFKQCYQTHISTLPTLTKNSPPIWQTFWQHNKYHHVKVRAKWVCCWDMLQTGCQADK